jgi:hypothetical protein
MSQFTQHAKTAPPGGWLNRTYQLPAQVVKTIDRLAGELGVGQSDLVSYLLETVLSQYENGQIKVPLATRMVASVVHKYEQG